MEESGVGVVAVGVGRGAFVKSLVSDAQFAAGQLLARAQRRSAVEEDGILPPLDVERRIATDGTPEGRAGPPPDGRSVSVQQLDEWRTVDVKGRHSANVVSDAIGRLALVVALVRRGVHWADDQLAGQDKRPVSVENFVKFRPFVFGKGPSDDGRRDAMDSAVELDAVSVYCLDDLWRRLLIGPHGRDYVAMEKLS